ncbi:MAG: hypothetical protein FGF51_08180 [Candidatus Brockarchaeota archaeon]|nr:hypothetical protein [Candidatus Brockarchaeota archaeon]
MDKVKSAELDRLIEEGKIPGSDYWKLFQEKVVVKGIEGMKKFIEQMPGEYEEIAKLYPNGKVGKWNEDPRGFTNGWLADRFCHGLENTVGQYVGFDDNTIQYFKNKITDWNEMEFCNKLNESMGIYQFLTKYWKPWDLVKFIYGYERFSFSPVESDIGINVLSQAYKAFGVPSSAIIISPAPIGTMPAEWSVVIPDSIVSSLRQALPNSRIVLGNGNMISLYSGLDGLDKDGIREILYRIRNINTYLWKK